MGCWVYNGAALTSGLGMYSICQTCGHNWEESTGDTWHFGSDASFTYVNHMRLSLPINRGHSDPFAKKYSYSLIE